MKQTVISKRSKNISGLLGKVENTYLLLGSNLGDRMSWLQYGREACSAGIGKIVQASHIYETEPWGKVDQPGFLNQAILLETDLDPMALLESIAQIEKGAERQRVEVWGPRTLDIDILFYGDLVIRTSRLSIPHPQLHNRKFALKPLSEIAPDLIHPEFHLTIRELVDQSVDHSEVSILPD